MRRDKGFFFLLDALADLPEDLARRVHLVVAAPKGSEATMVRLHGLTDRLASIDYADGYNHDNLDTILSAADVGVVPVLWEDNLPQVAIEMHARHIPLLTLTAAGPRSSRVSGAIFPQATGGVRRANRVLLKAGSMPKPTGRALPPRSMNEHAMNSRKSTHGGDRGRPSMPASWSAAWSCISKKTATTTLQDVLAKGVGRRPCSTRVFEAYVITTSWHGPCVTQRRRRNPAFENLAQKIAQSKVLHHPVGEEIERVSPDLSGHVGVDLPPARSLSLM